MLFLMACFGNVHLYEQRQLELIDADNDGFTIQDGDCDDQEAGVYPGADEVCDGVDNNCDGNIDHKPTKMVIHR